MKEGSRFLVRVASGMAALALAAASASAAEPFPVPIGAAFELTDHRGAVRSSDEFRGRLVLAYFGYTACPHSCGMALNTISAALDELGPQAGSVVPLFVTVDPEHDGPDRLARHLRNFHPAIIGLTGSASRITGLRDGYRVAAQKVAEPGAFERLFEHTTFIYLMGPDGEPLSLLQPMMPPARIAEIIRGYL